MGLLLLSITTPPLAIAQSGNYEVSGVVLDAAGLPIIGATVIENGTTNGTSTDIDGKYVLKVR